MTQRFTAMEDELQIYFCDEFRISPCMHGRSHPKCTAEEAEFWAIFGDLRGEFVPIHIDTSARAIVKVAAQIMHETGKPFSVMEVGRRRTMSHPDILGLAQHMTEWIIDDLPDIFDPEDEDARDDDFDNHPLAELREALVDYSDYGGLGTALDPYA